MAGLETGANRPLLPSRPVLLRLSEHARLQAARRGIAEDVVLAVARAPEQTIDAGDGREVRQSRVSFGENEGRYLVRVVVDRLDGGALIVTAYRTSKIEKYWGQE